MKKIIVAIVMTFLQTVIFAQNPGEIKGKIVDSKTKEALVGATVSISGGTVADVADKYGNFTLKPLDPGTYNVNITFMGYDTMKYYGVLVNADKITFLDTAYMATGINVIIGCHISATRIIDPEAPSKISIPRTEFIKLPDHGDINMVVRDMCSDVQVSDDGGEIYFRGSRNGDAVYYVDGVKLMDNQLHVPGLAIGSLTVYSGGVPAKYGDFTGGVVVVETQSYFSWLNSKRAAESVIN